MGNVPRDKRVPEQAVVDTIQRARDHRRPVVAELMAEFGIVEHQAKYHYQKVTQKGLISNRRGGHYPRIAIMFLNSPNEERIELCQVCKSPWPCSWEINRQQHEVPDGK